MPKDRHDVIWELEPHTKAKHELLRHYLNAWMPTLSLSKWVSSRIIIMDGFAGPGVYKGGEDGSPRVILRTLLDHTHVEKMLKVCEILVILNEADEDRAAELASQVEAIKSELGGLPKKLHIAVRDQGFVEMAESLLEHLDGKMLAPTFAFLDPFGYSDIPMDLIRRLMDHDSCELFIYFGFNSINRFATAGIVDERLQELYGTDEFKNAPEEGQARWDFLRDLYARQLRDVAGFDYVRSFRMVNSRGLTPYYLFFCTRHPDGLDKMKQAMWKVAPAGNYTFDDRVAGQESFDVDTTPLREQLIAEFGGRSVAIEDVMEFTKVGTEFPSTFLKRKTMAQMKTDGLIEVDPPQKQAAWFPAGCTVTFH